MSEKALSRALRDRGRPLGRVFCSEGFELGSVKLSIV